jgi:hypothetical protein
MSNANNFPTAPQLASADADPLETREWIDALEAVIAHSKAELRESRPIYSANREEASAIILTKASYDFLEDLFPGAVSDAHRIQLLLAQLSR